VEVVAYKQFQPKQLNALLGYFSPRPRSVVDTYSAEMDSLVQQIVRDRSYELLIACQIDTAPYAHPVKGLPKVLEEAELTTLYERFAKERHPLKRLRAALTWWKLREYMARLLTGFDGCTVVSKQEQERIMQVAPGLRSVAVVANGVDVNHYAGDYGPVEPDTLVYAGALTYRANFDAMSFFLREVFPLIRASRPGVMLYITGRQDGVPLHRLPHDDSVVFTGYLDDIRPRVARSWVSVVPLRIGGGTRLKVLESLALGTPVVATRKGIEGLDLVPGRDLLVADQAGELASAVLRVLGSERLRAKLSKRGRATVKSTYEWQVQGQRFDDFVRMVAQRSSVKPESNVHQ
jgi:glycosyltransferase involved in cell wall biosynthesis